MDTSNEKRSSNVLFYFGTFLILCHIGVGAFLYNLFIRKCEEVARVKVVVPEALQRQLIDIASGEFRSVGADSRKAADAFVQRATCAISTVITNSQVVTQAMNDQIAKVESNTGRALSDWNNNAILAQKELITSVCELTNNTAQVIAKVESGTGRALADWSNRTMLAQKEVIAAIYGLTNDATRIIGDGVKAFNEEQSRILHAEMNGSTSAIARVDAGVQKLLSKDSDRIQRFLEKARDNSLSEEQRSIMYMSALSISPEKEAIYLEYFGFETNEINNALIRHDFQSARDSIGALAALYDTTMLGASPTDIEELPKIKEKISSAKNALESAELTHIATQRSKLNEIAIAKSDEDMTNVVANLKSFPCHEDLVEERDSLVAEMEFKIAVKNIRDGQDFSIPNTIAEEQVVALRDAFAERMMNPKIPIERRMTDFAVVKDKIIESALDENASVDDSYSNLVASVKNAYDEFWTNQCMSIAMRVKNGSYTLEVSKQAETLLSQYESLPATEQVQKRSGAEILYSIVFYDSIEESEKQWRIVDRISRGFNEDISLQLLSTVQAQYLQILLRMNNLGQQGLSPSNPIYQLILQRVRAIADIQGAYADKRVADSLTEQDRGQESYLKWAKGQIASARYWLNEGEKIASTFWKTRGNKTAQGYYKNAWDEIAQIHPDDLRSLSAEDSMVFESLKQQIENCRRPSDEERQSVQVTRLGNFVKKATVETETSNVSATLQNALKKTAESYIVGE